MTRPRILLVPQFTEVEWSIAPLLAEWADVATFDAPGVGGQPLPDEDPSQPVREPIVERGLEEIECVGWDRYFVAGDSLGMATAVRLARRRPEAVLGLALGHAALSNEAAGERAPLNAEIYAAMSQLVRNDYESFVRFGITQMTQGTFDEATAAEMIDRFPPMETGAGIWDRMHSDPEPIGEWLRELDKPLLFAKHDGCVAHTPEGFEDAVAAFPGAQVVVCEKGPSADPAFASALRGFCLTVFGTEDG